MTKLGIYGAAGALAILLATSASARDSNDVAFRLIVHVSNGTQQLTADMLSRYFLKKKSHWSDGSKVLPVDLAPTAKLRADFSRHIHRKKTVAIKAYLRQMIFSGRALPPPEMRDEKAIVAYVASHPGAVGYISAKALSEAKGVKELRIVFEK